MIETTRNDHEETPADTARRLCDEGVDIYVACRRVRSPSVQATVINFMGFNTLQITSGEEVVRISWLPANKFDPSPTPSTPPEYHRPSGLPWDWDL